RRAYTKPNVLKTLLLRPLDDAALQVAARAAITREVPDAVALPVLRAAAVRRPDEFPIQYAAGIRTLRTNPAEAVGYFRAALALRPNNLAGVNGLGLALHHSRNPAEAAQHYLRAIELDPGFAS